MQDCNYVSIVGKLYSYHATAKKLHMTLESQTPEERVVHAEIICFEPLKSSLERQWEDSTLRRESFIKVYGHMQSGGRGRQNWSQNFYIVADSVEVLGGDENYFDNSFMFRGELCELRKLTSKMSIASIRMTHNARAATVPVVVDTDKVEAPPKIGTVTLTGYLQTRNILLPEPLGVSSTYHIERLHDFVCTQALAQTGG